MLIKTFIQRNKNRTILRDAVIVFALLSISCSAFGATTTIKSSPLVTKLNQAASEQTPAFAARVREEQRIEKNPFALSFYKPSYILPFYYTFSPDQKIYRGVTPENQRIKNLEFKGQLSFKAPLWQRIFGTNTTLYAAYTQMSYWQVYVKSAYFRETNYEPELFLTHYFRPWLTVATGIVHQSNGRGGDLERSWNRIYGEGILSLGNWMISIKPWFLIAQAKTSDIHNPKIAKYLGHARFLFAYKIHDIEFSLSTRNNLESKFKRGSLEFAVSFPLLRHFSGYAQFFTGYGQSLIEYNHYTNAVGFGIAFNNWI